MPPIVPQPQRFAQKTPRNFVQKNFPTSPLKGDWGTKTALLTAQKSAAIMQGKRTATATAAQRTADHGHGRQSGDQSQGDESLFHGWSSYFCLHSKPYSLHRTAV